LPSSISNDPALFFFWDDLADANTDGYLEYTTRGSAPGRVFSMYFRNHLKSGSCGNDAVAVMITVHERSNLVTATYGELTPCAQIRGGLATFGIQGAGGVNAQHVLIGVNSPILDDTAPRQSMSFRP
jgi:hypothetical protein